MEHLADKPITFKSKKDLRKYCAAKGVSSYFDR